MSNSFWNSISEWFKEKMTSPLYGVFFAAFVMYNWKKFYILFWEYGAPRSGTRLEFLNTYLLPYHGDNSFTLIGNWLWAIVPPLVTTYVVLRWVPVMQNWAHGWHTKFYYARKEIEQLADIQYQEKLNIHLEKLAKVKTKQIGNAKTVEDLTKEINDLLSTVATLQEEGQESLKYPKITEMEIRKQNPKPIYD